MQANIININGNPIEQIIYKNQPVITLRMMDEVHERPEGTAGRNFNQHKEKLTEGEHYFSVPYKEWSKISTLRNSYSSKGHNKKIFLTLYGYLVLVRTFSDDLAWKIQEELVKAYFQTKKAEKAIDPLDQKINRLEKITKMRGKIDLKEYNQLKREVLGDTAVDLPVIHAKTPILQLLELLVHASKSGHVFEGVTITIDESIVITYTSQALNTALSIVGKENNLRNPYKTSSQLSNVIRNSDMLRAANWMYEGKIRKKSSGDRVYRLVRSQE